MRVVWKPECRRCNLSVGFRWRAKWNDRQQWKCEYPNGSFEYSKVSLIGGGNPFRERWDSRCGWGHSTENGSSIITLIYTWIRPDSPNCADVIESLIFFLFRCYNTAYNRHESIFSPSREFLRKGLYAAISMEKRNAHGEAIELHWPTIIDFTRSHFNNAQFIRFPNRCYSVLPRVGPNVGV